MLTFNSHISRGAARRTVLILAALLGATFISVPGAALVRSPATIGVETEEGLAPRPKWELAPAVEATFLRESYRPGAVASLVLWRTEQSLTLQVFHAGPGYQPNRRNTVRTVLPV